MLHRLALYWKYQECQKFVTTLKIAVKKRMIKSTVYTIRNKVMSFLKIFDYKIVEFLIVPDIECLAQI